jgi:hypothetical protein
VNVLRSTRDLQGSQGTAKPRRRYVCARLRRRAFHHDTQSMTYRRRPLTARSCVDGHNGIGLPPGGGLGAPFPPSSPQSPSRREHDSEPADWGWALPVQVCVSICGQFPGSLGRVEPAVSSTGEDGPINCQSPGIREPLRQTLDDCDQLLTTESLVPSKPKQVLRSCDHRAARRSATRHFDLREPGSYVEAACRRSTIYRVHGWTHDERDQCGLFRHRRTDTVAYGHITAGMDSCVASTARVNR